MKNFDFSKIQTFLEVLKPYSKKYNLDEFSLALLLALNENCDISNALKEEYSDNLIKLQFAQRVEKGLKITGKGSIVAKSIAIGIEK
ncbi:MAG: hypothetical protein IJP34_01520 [Clostridia bacterium]|nr:hypothetical protein [Clostridia bacterium]